MNMLNTQLPPSDGQALDLADTLEQVNGSLSHLITFLADRANTQSPLSPDACLQLIRYLSGISRTLFVAQVAERRRCDHG